MLVRLRPEFDPGLADRKLFIATYTTNGHQQIQTEQVL
jgi:hypothetical protein